MFCESFRALIHGESVSRGLLPLNRRDCFRACGVILPEALGRAMIYPDDYVDRILCGDCLDTMRRMPDACVDLVITSPPYNLKNSTGNGFRDGRGGKWPDAALQNGYATYDDNMPYDLYVAWQRECLAEMLRLTRPDGAVFYNHKWRVQAGLLQDRREILEGFPVRQILIWKRKGGINFNSGYFLPTYEVIYLLAKPGFHLAPKANAAGDVWEFAQDMNNEHPAPFPTALVERIITSTDAQLVMDPFSGSGTTAVVAKALGRHYIGIDISPDYCAGARRRIEVCRFGAWVAAPEPSYATGPVPNPEPVP